MSGIAIDLGSACSMAARLNEQAVPTFVPDSQASDQFRTPSLVHLGAIGPLVGHTAAVAAHAQPESTTIEDAKSMLASGRALGLDQAGKPWSAEDCVGLLLTKLQQDASSHCFQAVDEVLLTVPGRFTSPQRHALRRAAESAGLRVRALVDECLAAGVYAASQAVGDQTLLVLQWGRSGFEAAVIRCSQHGASLMAARHDSSLGGKSIDRRLADEICSAEGWSRESLPPIAVKQLLCFAEQLKRELCQAEANSTETGIPAASAPSRTPSLTAQVQLQGLVGKSTVEFILTRWHFEQIIAPMLERVLDVVEKCLADSELDWNKVDRVILAGGASQLPALRTELKQRSGLPLERIVSKDCLTAVVYGGALLAAQSDEQLARYDCMHRECDVAAGGASAQANEGSIAMFDVGIRIGDPRSGQAAIYKLIKRGGALPAQASKQFRTSRAGQPRLVIEAVKTTGSIRRAESLGHFSLALPPDLPANHPVMVTMYCDAAGQIRVDAESMPGVIVR